MRQRLHSLEPQLVIDVHAVLGAARLHEREVEEVAVVRHKDGGLDLYQQGQEGRQSAAAYAPGE